MLLLFNSCSKGDEIEKIVEEEKDNRLVFEEKMVKEDGYLKLSELISWA